MKFGETLWQRSVPQWRNYNLDYASIKKLIKEHTTTRKGKFIPVPGRDETSVDTFEDELFLVFAREHDRATLFVKSKGFEINSRLASIQRHINNIECKRPHGEPHNTAVAARERFSRIELEILNVGNEIQQLSRYISINRLAIRKLLKKYRKWTGSTELDNRVNGQVLSKRESFTRFDLKSVLNQYTAFLDTIRSTFEKRSPSQDTEERPPIKTGKRVHTHNHANFSLFQTTAVNFDTGLAMPSERYTEKAIYWVHPDNIVELRIFLLQYMRYAKAAVVPVGNPTSNSTKNNTYRIESKDKIGMVILDHLERFSRTQSGTTMAKNELHNDRVCGGAVSARWAADGEAIVFIPSMSGECNEDVFKINKARLRLNELGPFLNTAGDFPTRAEPEEQCEKGVSLKSKKMSQDQEAVRSWLSNQKDLEPLVHVCCTRSRLIGLENGPEQGIWAALDEEVYMRRSSFAQLNAKDFFMATDREKIRFPHALLSIRAESADSSFIKTLDQCHLIERVPGFSIEVHAVAVCCKPGILPTPHWIASMEKDIRRIPQCTESPSSRSSTRGLSSGSWTSKDTSASTASQSEGPATPNGAVLPRVSHFGAKKKDQKALVWTPQYRPIQEASRSWNEYDHPDSDDNNNAYFVEFDPNTPLFPGQEALARWSRKITGIFSSPRSRQDLERGRLGGSSTTINAASSVSGSSSDEDDETSAAKRPLPCKVRRSLPPRNQNNLRSYGAIPGSQSPVQQTPTQTPSRTTVICLVASVVILAILSVLVSTARRRFRRQVDVATFAGAAASLAFALFGMVVFLRQWLRHEGMGRLGGGTAAVVFVAVCAGNGWLVAFVINAYTSI